jgi:cytochrome b involved in lipid metabolism
MQTRLLIGVIAIIFLGVIGVALLQRPATSAPSSPATRTDTVGDAGTPMQGSSASGQTYTLADVAQHNNASSCWAAINGNVYDLTNWINQHPGGPQRILNICGTDGSAAFNNQHGGQSRPADELSQFLLGPLQ